MPVVIKKTEGSNRDLALWKTLQQGVRDRVPGEQAKEPKTRGHQIYERLLDNRAKSKPELCGPGRSRHP